MSKTYRQEILVALSLANLLCVAGWRKVLYFSDPVYNIKHLPRSIDFWAMIATVLLTAAVLLAGVWLTRYLLKEKYLFFPKIIFLLVTIFAFLEITAILLRSNLWIANLIGRKNILIVCTVLAAIGIVLTIFKFSRVFSLVKLLILIFSPLVILTFTQAIYKSIIADTNAGTSDFYNVSKISKNAGRNIKARVVWIIFDEMEYRSAFEKRPKDLSMPEFEMLKRQSIFATEAEAPSSNTLNSIPSLITGKNIKSAEFAGKDLLLTFAKNSKRIKFSQAPNIFSEVKNLGGNSAVVGWYHPYCRLFAKQLSACYWASRDYPNDFVGESFLALIFGNYKRILNAFPVKQRTMLFKDYEYIKRHNTLISAAERVVSEPQIDLSFIHLTVPHFPNHYNRNKDNFSGGEGYIDNLALTDKILGKLRKSLEKNNLWDESVIIISSDHSWRLYGINPLTERDIAMTNEVYDPGIPLVIKLSHQSEPFIYERPINTIITRDLILNLMNGTLTQPEKVIKWLNSKVSNSKEKN